MIIAVLLSRVPRLLLGVGGLVVPWLLGLPRPLRCPLLWSIHGLRNSSLQLAAVFSIVTSLPTIVAVSDLRPVPITLVKYVILVIS